ITQLAFAAGFSSVRRFNAAFEESYHLSPSVIRRTASSAMDQGEQSLVLGLAYRPPYAWQALLAYLKGRAMPGLEYVDEERYLRSVRLDGCSGWISVSHKPEKNQLMVEIASSLLPVLMPLLSRVRRQFDVEAHPCMIASHLEQDSLLAAQIAKTPGLRVPSAFEPFELAIRAILGQQVSVAGATTISGRLVERFGDLMNPPHPQLSYHFPSPQKLAQADIGQLAQLGMPQSRATTLKDFAMFAANGGLEFPANASLDEVVSRLKSVKGIGEWTAQYIAMRALRFSNAFPAGDLGLQKAAAIFPETRCKEKDLLQGSQAWAPWRAYAALLLWQSLS
ncbi:MAG: DNA-3-methyladenine glycosylase 2, partial [Undibacterium sp.]|nr:DNA-3-methyladenine glycosylase 2 [Undibacterium sp.]